MAAAAGTAAPGVPASVLDVDRRIQEQRARLDDLLQRYTNDYPDVILRARPWPGWKRKENHA
jgi:hypothetical protein